jgi:hypothetical protein
MMSPAGRFLLIGHSGFVGCSRLWALPDGAQKHTDLRDHFERLAVPARKAAAEFDNNQNPLAVLQRDHAALMAHCEGLEQLLPRTHSGLHRLLFVLPPLFRRLRNQV